MPLSKEENDLILEHLAPEFVRVALQCLKEIQGLIQTSQDSSPALTQTFIKMYLNMFWENLHRSPSLANIQYVQMTQDLYLDRQGKFIKSAEVLPIDPKAILTIEQINTIAEKQTPFSNLFRSSNT